MISNKPMNKRYSIKLFVANMFLIAIVITATVAIVLQYHASKKIAVTHMLSSLDLMSNQMSNNLNKIDIDAKRTVNLLSNLIQPNFSQESVERKSRLFSSLLKNHSDFYSLYVGDKQEHFFQLINLQASKEISQKMQALPDDKWAAIVVKDGPNGRQRHTYYYSSTFHLNHQYTQSSNFYPSERPWFSTAPKNGVYKTKPYLFQHLQITGQTYSQRIGDTNQVIGLDILLSSTSKQLTEASKALFADGTQSFLFRQHGEIIASNLQKTHAVSLPRIAPLHLSKEQSEKVAHLGTLKVSNQNDWRPFDFSESGLPSGYLVDLMQIVSAMTGLKFDYINGFSRDALLKKYQRGEIDILLSVQKFGNDNIKGLYSSPLLDIPYGIATKNRSQPITTLTDLNNQTIGYLNRWNMDVSLEKRLPKVHWKKANSLQQLFSDLENGQVDAVIGASQTLTNSIKSLGLENIKVYKKITSLNATVPNRVYLVSHEQNKFAIGLINSALAHITPAERDALSTSWLKPTSQDLQDYLSIPITQLLSTAEQSTKEPFVLSKADNGTKYYIFTKDVDKKSANQSYLAIIVPEKKLYEQATQEAYHSALFSAGLMVLLLPIIWLLSWPIVRPIKQLQLETEKIGKRQFQEVNLIDSNITEIWQLSCSFQEMAQEIKQHEAKQKEFMDALIRLIADAIDNKSVHTGNHCHRVPELGLMLSNALEQAQEGPYKDFKFANDNERREFRIAAWLHDCGKITMPEHIMDKGAKLECNYNRIHEIRTRFEVLWRDAQIDYMQAVYIEKQSPDVALKQWQVRQEELQEQFQFIAKANVGSESMNQENEQKIKEIGRQVWTRHFNNRLGLSPAEELLIAEQSQTSEQDQQATEYAFAQETLLSDKPEHIIPRIRDIELDPSLGINMDIPKYQYNLGELYNLSIQNGTLTEEDRFKIKEHMISTIHMLEGLPFPPELSRVPHYASTHHERMDGQGYPRKLHAEQLTIPDRILMIADVFEALTASDRPYKKANSLSSAIDLMYNMCKKGHLDMTMFRFFLESDTYLQYAERFLPESQRDTVDIKAYSFE
ncbi:Cyclic di-GMP phosphodiesterase response regulator RpfG [Marinomonas spartinae]|uniref:HD domain-containing phosphohydrolase n=1 Tax=Marinomonas spartinae TaxID=1792290 RepID=UPI0008090DED|nr:HD domain-containing phosphohydrolase [Marinomonas spartinae]SBS28946.1 Cyclic di-GMP phosphodiesterase response regulator RpfG [Marinomonas spartinae]